MAKDTTRTRQSRGRSLIETCTQIGIGFVIAFLLQRFAVGHVFGHEFDTQEAFDITIMFTVAALVRNYTVRRGFERWG